MTSKHHLAQPLSHRRKSVITCVAQSQRQNTGSAKSRGKREVKVKVLRKMSQRNTVQTSHKVAEGLKKSLYGVAG